MLLLLLLLLIVFVAVKLFRPPGLFARGTRYANEDPTLVLTYIHIPYSLIGSYMYGNPFEHLPFCTKPASQSVRHLPASPKTPPAGRSSAQGPTTRPRRRPRSASRWASRRLAIFGVTRVARVTFIVAFIVPRYLTVRMRCREFGS